MQEQYECEIDSGTRRDDEVDFEVVSKTSLTKSGRAVRAFVRLDFLKSALFDGYISIALTAKTSSYHLPSVR